MGDEEGMLVYSSFIVYISMLIYAVSKFGNNGLWWAVVRVYANVLFMILILWVRTLINLSSASFSPDLLWYMYINS